MQTSSWSLNSTEKCLQSSRGCRMCEGVFPFTAASTVDGLDCFPAESIHLWTSILKALGSGSCLGSTPVSINPNPKKKEGKSL